MRDFEPLGAELERKLDVARHVVNVLPVDRRVDGERQAELRHPTGDVELLLRGTWIGADALGVLRIDVLEGDLHVIEATLDQLFEARAGQGDGGGDQIGVKAGLGGGRNDVLEVLARRRLAAGEVHLQDAHGTGLLHHRHPFGGGQFLVDALKLERVRAIGALQRTAMG